MGVAVVVVVLAVTVVLTTTGSDSKSAVVVLSEAAARTTSSGTAQSSSVETITVGTRTLTPLRIDASADFANKTSTLTLFGLGDRLIDSVRIVAGVAYFSSPLVTTPLPGGAHWVSVTPADMKLAPDAAATVGSNDPSAGLQYLSAIDGNPRVIDHSRLDGVNVTHYAFTLNLQSRIAQLGKSTSALGVPAFARALQQVQSLVDLTKLPGEAWIDADGRVRRLVMTIVVTQAGQTGKVVTDVRFSHFNEPVTIVAPHASDTVSFAQVPHFFSDFVHHAAVGG